MWFGVEVGEGFGQGALEDADAVGVAEGVAGVHGFDVEGFVVAVEADGFVEQVGRGLRVAVEQVVGEQEVGFDAPPADGFAVRLDPFVVVAVGERRAVEVAGRSRSSSRRRGPLAVGRGSEQVAQLPDVDVDGGGVEAVAAGAVLITYASLRGPAARPKTWRRLEALVWTRWSAWLTRASGSRYSPMSRVDMPSGWQARNTASSRALAAQRPAGSGDVVDPGGPRTRSRAFVCARRTATRRRRRGRSAGSGW